MQSMKRGDGLPDPLPVDGSRPAPDLAKLREAQQAAAAQDEQADAFDAFQKQQRELAAQRDDHQPSDNFQRPFQNDPVSGWEVGGKRVSGATATRTTWTLTSVTSLTLHLLRYTTYSRSGK